MSCDRKFIGIRETNFGEDYNYGQYFVASFVDYTKLLVFHEHNNEGWNDLQSWCYCTASEFV